MIRNVLFLLPALFFIYTISAQTQKRLYLFDKYTKGVVLLRSHAIVPAFLNYDAANCNMMYVEGENEMILDNIQQVDTVFIGNRSFIPAGHKGFLEVMKLKNGIMYLYWKLTDRFIGKKGAYGQTIQGTVENININMVRHQAGYERRTQNFTDIYTRQNENEYWLKRNGKFVKCKNKKSLLKLFPGKEMIIKEYIEDNKIDFDNIQQVIDLLDYCLDISKV